ncbi:MAG TPA: NADH-quinone oxidoreductase subunit C, partial [Acidimicrobiales bacterium]|nr:NADH-quinone oxidoreductase subunit C [Acidimicrobiales bacterium]
MRTWPNAGGENPLSSPSDATGADAAEAPEAEPEPEEAAPPSAQTLLLDELTGVLGDGIVASEELRRDLWVRVRPDAWRAAAEACKSIGFDYFCFLSGIDWMPSTSPNPKAGVAAVDVGDEGSADAVEAVVEEETAQEVNAEERVEAGAAGLIQTGHAGGDTRFQVFGRLYSTRRHLGVTLKADLDDENPSIATWSDIYAGADWHEREAWEMFGFDFTGHPGLQHLYLPGEFEGFPMRKDFPLLSREVKPWPGLVDVELMPEEP